MKIKLNQDFVYFLNFISENTNHLSIRTSIYNFFFLNIPTKIKTNWLGSCYTKFDTIKCAAKLNHAQHVKPAQRTIYREDSF